MEEVPCVHCGVFFSPRNKNQNYSSRPDCQKARKAAWQRNKLRTDPEYRASRRISRRISRRKWQRNNPEYWKQYRQDNPDKVERNRALQRVRNRQRDPENESQSSRIAKIDAGNSRSHGLSGTYWLIPVIAKMDAAKIYIHAISDG
jgi:hypothetical protein